MRQATAGHTKPWHNQAMPYHTMTCHNTIQGWPGTSHHNKPWHSKRYHVTTMSLQGTSRGTASHAMPLHHLAIAQYSRPRHSITLPLHAPKSCVATLPLKNTPSHGTEIECHCTVPLGRACNITIMLTHGTPSHCKLCYNNITPSPLHTMAQPCNCTISQATE